LEIPALSAAPSKKPGAEGIAGTGGSGDHARRHANRGCVSVGLPWRTHSAPLEKMDNHRAANAALQDFAGLNFKLLCLFTRAVTGKRREFVFIHKKIIQTSRLGMTMAAKFAGFAAHRSTLSTNPGSRTLQNPRCPPCVLPVHRIQRSQQAQIAKVKNSGRCLG